MRGGHQTRNSEEDLCESVDLLSYLDLAVRFCSARDHRQKTSGMSCWLPRTEVGGRVSNMTVRGLRQNTREAFVAAHALISVISCRAVGISCRDGGEMVGCTHERHLRADFVCVRRGWVCTQARQRLSLPGGRRSRPQFSPRDHTFSMTCEGGRTSCLFAGIIREGPSPPRCLPHLPSLRFGFRTSVKRSSLIRCLHAVLKYQNTARHRKDLSDPREEFFFELVLYKMLILQIWAKNTMWLWSYRLPNISVLTCAQ